MCTNPGVEELLGRQVDADPDRRLGQGLLPLLELLARAPDGERADRHHLPRLLGQGDEDARAHQPALDVRPTDQGLEALRVSRLEVDDRLIVELQLAPLDRPLEVRLELDSRHGAGVHLGVEERVVLGPAALCAHQGGPGVREHLLGLGVAAGRHHDAHVATGEDLASVVEADRHLEGRRDLLRSLLRVLRGLDALEEEAEHVGGQAGERHRPTDARAQAPGQGRDEGAAHAAIEPIHHVLEAAHLDHAERHVPARRAPLQRVTDEIGEVRAVGEPGLAVVACPVKQRPLGAALACHVQAVEVDQARARRRVIGPGDDPVANRDLDRAAGRRLRRERVGRQTTMPRGEQPRHGQPVVVRHVQRGVVRKHDPAVAIAREDGVRVLFGELREPLRRQLGAGRPRVEQVGGDRPQSGGLARLGS